MRRAIEIGLAIMALVAVIAAFVSMAERGLLW